jgi:multicomponent Na+:H+ antiporter subunit D
VYKRQPLDPDDLFPLQAAAGLASFGLLLLLAPWPLHGPALSLGHQAPPLVAAWLLTVLAVVPLALLQELLTSYEWLQDASLTFSLVNVRLSELLVYGGLAGGLWAGLGALVQRDLRRQWSYVAMFSYGAILVSLGLGARSSWGLVWLLMLTRTAALLVSAFGLAVINQRAGGRCDHLSIQGLATRLPWASAAFLLGGLSLAGLPLTAGFAGQWALLQALGSRDWVLAALLLLGALGLVAGLARSQQVLLGRLENLLLEREERLMVIIAGIGLALIILPALWPQLWRSTSTSALPAFSATAGGL